MAYTTDNVRALKLIPYWDKCTPVKNLFQRREDKQFNYSVMEIYGPTAACFGAILGALVGAIVGIPFHPPPIFVICMGVVGALVWVYLIYWEEKKRIANFRKFATASMEEPLFHAVSKFNALVEKFAKFLEVKAAVDPEQTPEFLALLVTRIESLENKREELTILLKFFDAAKNVEAEGFDDLGDLFLQEVPGFGSMKDQLHESLRKLSASIEVEAAVQGTLPISSKRRA